MEIYSHALRENLKFNNRIISYLLNQFSYFRNVFN